MDKPKLKEVAEKLAKGLGITDAKVMTASIRKQAAEFAGVEEKDIDDATLAALIMEIHASGKADDVMRDFGIVPKPGWFSGLSGWHDIQHMRTKGFGNKVAGGSSIVAKLGCATAGVLILLGRVSVR